MWQFPLLDSRYKCPIARNLMIALVAGGGFEPPTFGYEANRINDSSAFQRLDGAGNDRKSLKRHQSTPIGPQSDHARVEHPQPLSPPTMQ